MVFLYPKLMKTDILPFPIGMEYEDLEFDLEVLPERIKGYDSYIYVGKDLKNFLNNPTDKIELIFHWEILVAIIISVEYCEADLHLDLLKYLLLEKKENYTFYINDEISLITLENRVMYGRPDVISILSILLC